MRLGYLVSRYPAISHSFILREVVELRALGFEIEVASINLPDRPGKALTRTEKEEAEKAFYVKQAGIRGAVAAQVEMLLREPHRYFAGLLFALGLARADLKQLAFCVFYFFEAVMLAGWMRERSLGHLHVHFATPAATVALILTRVASIGISMTVHGPDEFYDVPGYFLSEKVRGARFVCAIGVYARSQLMKISPASQWDKFEIAPLGVDPEVFEPPPMRRRSERFEILCVGRLVPAKGQHILVSAVSQLVGAGRAIRLRLVGDGPDRQSLELEVRRLRLEDAVCFEGALNQDRTHHFYETADIFALASFAEGIPVVLMEAMAMEIPCVTTWIMGVPELIRNEIDGLLIAPSDVDALAGALMRLMDDAELRQRLGRAGRLRIQDRYNLSRNVTRLAEIFDRRLGVHA